MYNLGADGFNDSAPCEQQAAMQPLSTKWCESAFAGQDAEVSMQKPHLTQMMSILRKCCLHLEVTL